MNILSFAVFPPFSIIFSSFLAHAEVFPESKLVEGQPIEFIWPDGRIGIIEQGVLVKDSLRSNYEIIENSCSTVERVKCTYNAGTGMQVARLVWKEHPDKSKIGKNVQLKFKSELQNPLINFEDPIFWFNVLALSSGGPYAEIPADELTCPNWEWLGLGEKLPQQVSVAELASEIMLFNSETGRMENRTAVVATGVNWEKTSDQTLSIRSIERFDSYFFGFDNLLAGDVINWHFNRGQDQNCQVSVKPGLIDDFLTYYYLQASKSKENFKTYIYSKETYKLFDNTLTRTFIDKNQGFPIGMYEIL